MQRFIFILTIVLFVQFHSHAQGCVAVRQMGGLSMCSSDAYNISKGDYQVGTNYRYFHSWRHFVGTAEQPHRQNTGGGIGLDGIDHGNRRMKANF